MAWIRLKPNESLTIDELRDFCQGKLAHYKIPRYLHLTDEMRERAAKFWGSNEARSRCHLQNARTRRRRTMTITPFTKVGRSPVARCRLRRTLFRSRGRVASRSRPSRVRQ